MNISVSFSNQTSRFREKIASLTGRQLHEAMGVEVQDFTFNYVSALAATRHTTANKLGAEPTNFLARAAEQIAAPAALSVESDAATLTINHPGLGRALRDVVIRPKSAKSLAIPIHAIAYGHRAAELWDTLHLFIPKGKRYIAMKSDDGSILPLFVLCRSVTQKQDRTLLPSDDDLGKAAALGALKQVRAVTQS